MNPTFNMLKFYLKEILYLIARSKYFFVLSLISMVFSLMFINLFFLTYEYSSILEKKLKNEFSINIFIKDDSTGHELSTIEKDITSNYFVKECHFIDKIRASEIFIEETGEDFRKILDFNPLPASYVLKLRDEYVNPDSLKIIIPELSKINGVEEIVFKQEHISKLLDYLKIIKKYLMVITVIIILVTIYIFLSTTRLLINSRKDDIETMKLVGAKSISLKTPFICYSGVVGFLAGIISLFFSNLYISYFDNYINIVEKHNYLILSNVITLLLIGPVMGLIISYFSSKKLTLKID